MCTLGDERTHATRLAPRAHAVKHRNPRSNVGQSVQSSAPDTTFPLCNFIPRRLTANAYHVHQDKVNMHSDHVSGKIKQMKHDIALGEAEAASLNATLQALDGKQMEADDAIQELEDKRLAEQVCVPCVNARLVAS